MSAASSYLAAAAVVAAAGGAVKQRQIATENRRAERKNANITRAVEAFRNAQEARRGIAAARLRAAQAQALGEAQGVSGSSSISGASGSVFSQTASQIGAAQVQEAGAYGISMNNARLAKRVGSLANQAALFNTASQAFSAAASSGWGASRPTPSVPLAANQVPSLGAANPRGQSFNFSSYVNSFSNYNPFGQPR